MTFMLMMRVCKLLTTTELIVESLLRRVYMSKVGLNLEQYVQNIFISMMVWCPHTFGHIEFKSLLASSGHIIIF